MDSHSTETNTAFDPVAWIQENLAPEQVEAAAFIYDLMESQSGRCLPVIYEPFDAANIEHVADRGRTLDFVKSLGLGSRQEPRGRLLDFGPGDGWPSLIVAPFCEEVVGIDASARRVEVCRGNATRLGINNAQFTHVPAGKPLPFPDDSFDGITAASSLESTPDPQATLRELYRVLKPGGRLRMYYEALNRYRDGQEREAWISGAGFTEAFIIIYDRFIEAETVNMYRLSFDLAPQALREVIAGRGLEPSYTGITAALLAELRPHISSTAKCVMCHPTGRTWKLMLLAAGFSAVAGTHSGGVAARRLLGKLPDDERPTDLVGVESMLTPFIGVTVTMPAPLGTDPMLTAVK